MLDLRPAFLPLQPLSPAQMMKLGVALSPSLDGDSIASLRDSLRPFPLLSLQRRKLEFVSLGHADEGEGEPEVRLARELVVRPMKRADVEQVQELQDASLPVSYPSSFYTVLLTNSSSLSLVAYHPSDPSTLLGTIAAQITYPAPSFPSPSTPHVPTIYILSLSVKPSFRRHGLATHLLQSITASLLPPPLLDHQKQQVRLSLHVEARNEGARKMYERNGLRVVARRRGFYSRLRGGGNGEALEMEGLVRS